MVIGPPRRRRLKFFRFSYFWGQSSPTWTWASSALTWRQATWPPGRALPQLRCHLCSCCSGGVVPSQYSKWKPAFITFTSEKVKGILRNRRMATFSFQTIASLVHLRFQPSGQTMTAAQDDIHATDIGHWAASSDTTLFLHQATWVLLMDFLILRKLWIFAQVFPSNLPDFCWVLYSTFGPNPPKDTNLRSFHYLSQVAFLPLFVGK